MGKIQYSILPGLFAAANQQFIEKCSELYSNHYGIWGGEGVHPNKNIKLSPNKLQDWLANENVSIYYASDNDNIIGYAIAFSKDEKGYGIVTWVTQLSDLRRYVCNKRKCNAYSGYRIGFVISALYSIC